MGENAQYVKRTSFSAVPVRFKSVRLTPFFFSPKRPIKLLVSLILSRVQLYGKFYAPKQYVRAASLPSSCTSVRSGDVFADVLRRSRATRAKNGRPAAKTTRRERFYFFFLSAAAAADNRIAILYKTSDVKYTYVQ